MTAPSPIAAISGGLGDIGRAIGLHLQRDGYRVALGDLSETASAQAAGADLYTPVDVTDEASLEAWFAAIESHLGAPPHVLVVNAGIVLAGTALDCTVEDWRRTLDVNLTGAWLTARTGARRMRKLQERNNASILFIGSWVGQYPVRELPAYCASKAGLHSLMINLAHELAGEGIRVNEIAPGYVNAGLSAAIFKETPGRARRAAESTPTGRLIEPEEVAATAAWMVDPRNRNLTGATLTLDGGLSLLHGPRNLQAESGA